jgi:hypothetical protein
VRRRDLPSDVSELRELAAGRYDASREKIESRIEAHVTACRVAIDFLDATHTKIADGTDLDLEADTRQAAAWILAGRCIGLARALLNLLEDGFAAESVPTMRTLHETNRLLWAVSEEDEMAHRWIVDDDKKYVRPREARESGERSRAELHAALRAMKAQAEQEGLHDEAARMQDAIDSLSADEGARMVAAARQIYDMLSRIGHSRRSGMSDALHPELRRMVTGPHPDPSVRGGYVEYGTSLIEETLIHVGVALGRFFDGRFSVRTCSQSKRPCSSSAAPTHWHRAVRASRRTNSASGLS